jgi:hypothetical protein
MKLRLPLIATAVAGILAMSAGSVLATIPGTLDAHQTSWDTNLPAPVQVTAQTFVPGLSGALGTVQVHTNTFVAPAVVVVPNVTNVTVAIVATDGSGFPTGSALATQTVSPADPGWTTVTFGSPTNVVAGTKYAIELSQSLADTTRWDFICATDAYGPGQALILDTTWKTVHQFDGNLDCFGDFAFQTYIVVPNVTAPPTAPPTSTTGDKSGSTPADPSFLLIFAGLAVGASAAVFVSISRRRLTQR